ncbi:c-type cytochrome [Gracilimonas sp.]|uniref:c-type cytochrome n=1 Tax=Gracilimonas sp. TaxID=1974203 RepID=UPI0032EC3307
MHKFKKRLSSTCLALIGTSLLLTTGCNSSTDQEKEITQPPVSQKELGSTGIQTLPGFEAQLLYEVPRGSYGTWIALTVDSQGRLIASDQSNKGMYRVTINETKEKPEIQIEEFTIPLSGANGFTWKGQDLYANVGGKGIFKMSDERGDDQFDVLEFLGGPAKLAEHGNHSVVNSPNDDDIFVINGNYTPVPELTSSRLPNWDEDLLLPRMWDIRGNARGIYAPGGYIAKINPDATEWEMFSIGYRNIYDAAVNPHGELFTFDSDMEWDLGMPWYRPTRLIHVTSGSDYGWRSGSGKWKQYYEDSLQPTLNTGRGSPTGILFGTGAKFPAKYQHALFALDWLYGTIYAFHLSPDGSTYKAEAEKFLSGNALPLTDAVIGKDGALYFIIGGRSNDTKLYRVVYTGDESTKPAPYPDNVDAKQARQVRMNLEKYHGITNPKAVQEAWPHLNSDDHFIRYAARVAIESQPVNLWANKALNEDQTWAKINAIIALARSNSQTFRENATNSLIEMNLASLTPEQKLGYLRALSLVFMRLGDPTDTQKAAVTDKLQQLLPSEDARINTELVRLLVYIEDSRVIEKALALIQNPKPQLSKPNWMGVVDHPDGTIEKMQKNPPPVQQIEYAFMLRNVKNGWTIEQRREYFTFINEASKQLGGSSYTGYLRKIRDDALSNASKKEHDAVSDITGVSLISEPDFEVTATEGPGRDWTVNEAIVAVADHLTNRNFKNGRNAFFATGCASCHRFNGYGGNIGPDLSTIGLRSSVEVLLEDIIHPSSMISDQYSSSEVTLKNGDLILGLVVEEADTIKIYPRNADQLPITVHKEEVSSIEPSSISQMPADLLNPLNEEELRDLIAYLRSGGNPESDLFKK